MGSKKPRDVAGLSWAVLGKYCQAGENWACWCTESCKKEQQKEEKNTQSSISTKKTWRTRDYQDSHTKAGYWWSLLWELWTGLHRCWVRQLDWVWDLMALLVCRSWLSIVWGKQMVLWILYISHANSLHEHSHNHSPSSHSIDWIYYLIPQNLYLLDSFIIATHMTFDESEVAKSITSHDHALNR
jgi:hypothetical protein